LNFHLILFKEFNKTKKRKVVSSDRKTSANEIVVVNVYIHIQRVLGVDMVVILVDEEKHVG
jgi:hypothetical protein